MKCYKLNKCFEQRGRGCIEYRDIEEIRKEIIELNIEYGSSGRSRTSLIGKETEIEQKV